MKSAIDQQQGQAVLSGLYGDASKAQKTLEDLKKVSSRSPLEYTAYQEAASALAYAGVEGDSAVVSLENVGKAIVAAGGDSSKLGQATGGIMKAINNGGIAMMDSLGQISESGVPILSGLAEHFGVGIDEVKKMASEGKINITDVMSVMENATGDTFQQMLKAGDAASETFGSQWKIAKDNIQVALGEVLLPLIEKITPAIAPAAEAVVGFVEQIPAMLDGVKGAIQWVQDNIVWLGTFAASITVAGIASWVATGGLTALGGAIKGVFLAIGTGIKSIPVIGWVIAGIGLLVTALVWFFTKTESGQEIWAKVWGGIKSVFQGVMNWFNGTVVPLFQTIWGILFQGDFKGGSALEEDSPIVGALFGIRDAAIAVGSWVRDKLVPWLVGAWDAIAAGAIWLWKNAIKPAWGGIKTAASATWDWISGTLWPGIVGAWDAISGGATSMYEDGIKPAWSGFRDAISAVVDWITGTAVPFLVGAWEAVGAVFRWLNDKIVQPVWKAIRLVIAVAVTAILVYIDLLKWYFTNVIAPVALWLWRNVMLPAWNGIKAAIGAVAGWIIGTAWPLIKKAWDAIAAAAMWLWNNALKPAWDGIKTAISAVVSWLTNTAWPFIKRVWDAIASSVKWLYGSVIKPVWASIQAAIKVVVDWLKGWVTVAIEYVVGYLKASFLTWKIVAQAVWAAVKTAVKVVADWLRNTAWPAIRKVIDFLKKAFNTMRDSIKAAWQFVKDKAIQPVVNWLTNTIKPKIDRITDNIKDAFSTMKDSVLKAWDKIRDGMKSPINGIIRIYNKHVKGNFDKVAEKLDIDTRLPGMSEFATGGYTGPGSKYTPAGIVHADEYVIRKESQNDLRRNAPGFLDSLNKYGAKALGYASGGLVKLRKPFAGSYPRGDGFGARGGNHDGIDYPMPHGAVLKAVGAGHVRHTRNAAAGNKLELVLGNGLVAGYHHLSSYIAKNGSSVGRGADVARVGSTGRSSGPHLHFSLKRDGKYVDPMPYLGGGGEAGSGGGGLWNPFGSLWDTIKSKVADAVGGGMVGDILTKTASNTVGWAKEWVTGKLADIGDWGMEQVDGAANTLRATRWAPVATRALNMEGVFSRGNLSSLLRRMEQESGFNPRAINNWDSNARAGMASRGLMQVIPPTFRAYARPGYDKDIYDPLSNILASIRYTKSRYGSLRRGWDRKGGYADGGLVKPFLHDSGGWHNPGELSVNQTRKPEAVLTNGQWASIASLVESVREGRSGDTWNVYGADAREVAREVEVRQRRREALYAV